MIWLFKILGLMPFVNWLRPSFQDDSGNASYRRLTPFFLTAAVIYISIFQIKGEGIKKDIVYIFLGTSAFYASIITFQNVYSLYVAWKGGPPVITPPPAEPVEEKLAEATPALPADTPTQFTADVTVKPTP